MLEADKRFKYFNLLIYLYKANYYQIFLLNFDFKIMNANAPKAGLLITGIIGAIFGAFVWKIRRNSKNDKDDDSRFGRFFFNDLKTFIF